MSAKYNRVVGIETFTTISIQAVCVIKCAAHRTASSQVVGLWIMLDETIQRNSICKVKFCGCLEPEWHRYCSTQLQLPYQHKSCFVLQKCKRNGVLNYNMLDRIPNCWIAHLMLGRTPHARSHTPMLDRLSSAVPHTTKARPELLSKKKPGFPRTLNKLKKTFAHDKKKLSYAERVLFGEIFLN